MSQRTGLIRRVSPPLFAGVFSFLNNGLRMGVGAPRGVAVRLHCAEDEFQCRSGTLQDWEPIGERTGERPLVVGMRLIGMGYGETL
jgi:hypothetical protein